jgi:hypothetical protein
MTELAADDLALYEKFKNDPEFALMPKPRAWHIHLGIPVPEAGTPKDFLADQYYLKNQFSEKDAYEFHTEPQRDGQIVPLAPAENIPCKVVQRPLELPENPIEPVKFLPPVEEPAVFEPAVFEPATC